MKMMLFFATPLAFNCCPIWSDDKELKKQDRIKIFSTDEIVKLLE
jgi:predicted nucleic acid-binding protein